MHIGNHLRGLSKSYSMNTNMTRYQKVFKNTRVLVLWTKVALALEGLNTKYYLYNLAAMNN